MGTWIAEQLKARVGFGSVEHEVYLSILHTADGLNSEVSELLKPHRLTLAAYNVLRILRGAGGDGLPCTEIASRMLNRDPDITRLADRLAKRGLVERERQEEDRRVVKVSITKSGIALLNNLDEPILELHGRQLGHVGKKRLAELAKLLVAVRER